uniref:Protein krueppel n=2 Tax=Clastoptera arizonana TaxID=38151 RepID=A0A1B6CQM4_9HEMI
MDVLLYDSTICRFCAEDNTNGVFIFEKENQEIDLEKLINKYLPFKVNDDGTLPRSICPGCNIQLQATVQFFDLLAEGQKKINLLLKQQISLTLKKQELARIQGNLPTENIEYMPTDNEIFDNVIIEDHLTNVGNHLPNFEVLPDKDVFPPDHPISVVFQDIIKLPKKRGRPRKSNLSYGKIPSPAPVPNESNTSKTDFIEDKDDDTDGRRRRRRKIPERYKASVQGKELEKIFQEEGVIDDDEDDRRVVEDEVVEDANTNNVVEEVEEIIGHVESKEGQILEEYIAKKGGQTKIINKRHPKRMKRKKIRFICEVCGRGFLHQGRYLFHKSFHKGVKYECTTCHKRFSSKENFELHQKLVGHSGEAGIVEDANGDNEKPSTDNGDSAKVTCKTCDNKPFPTKTSLEGGKKDKFYPCSICGKYLNHPSSVVYHKEAEHNNGRRFVCNKCGKNFKHKQLLQRHQLVHTDIRPYKCTVCMASFKTKANLVNHQATHTGEKKHTCEICEQQFAHKTSLTLHYRWHTGLKPYQCNVCNKRFSQKGNLQEHIRIHTGEKPFACPHCPRKFTTSSQFKLHMKRHTGERPWKCEFCVKTFLHKDAWKCHIRRHKGEKPFSCPQCSRDFPEQWALKKHMRLHTGEKPYKCKECGKTFADCSNLTKHKKIHIKELKKDEQNNTEIKYISVSQDIPNAATAVNEGTDLSVWNIIQTHLQEDLVADRPNNSTVDNQEDVQSIIYVTLEENSCNEAKEKLDEELIVPDIVPALEVADIEVVGKNVISENIQITDDKGNPIHFTMQDGSAIEISSDGQSLQMTTKDGRTIPVHLATADGHPISTQVTADDSLQLRIDSVLEEEAPENDFQLNESVQTLEFMTEDGEKVQMIAPFNVVPMGAEFL